jgi:hypothetical protein
MGTAIPQNGCSLLMKYPRLTLKPLQAKTVLRDGPTRVLPLRVVRSKGYARPVGPDELAAVAGSRVRDRSQGERMQRVYRVGPDWLAA